MKRSGKIIFGVIAAVAFISPPLLHSFAGIGISPILTGSMRPYAQPGDIFITKNVPASQLRVGDIISVKNATSGVLYAHRIITVTALNGTLSIITKGDANSTAEVDPFNTSVTHMVPKNIFRLLWLGRPMVYLTSQSGRQMGLAWLVGANVLALFVFVFRARKVIISRAEAIYRSLYMEERQRSVQNEKVLAGKRSYVTGTSSNNQEDHT
jgi:signal peptidase I